MKQIVTRIQHCEECPHFRLDGPWFQAGCAGHPQKWRISLGFAGKDPSEGRTIQEMIHGSVNHNPPDWCPLPDA